MRRPVRPLSDRQPRRAQISAEQLGSLSHEFRTPLNGGLRQILLNFAGNAVKFTPSGGVLMRAVLPAPGRVRFVVEDTGPGVTAAQRERIFEAFAQAEAGHAHSGVGLGLAIARKLARAM